jgi:hypothetical protein
LGTFNNISGKESNIILQQGKHLRLLLAEKNARYVQHDSGSKGTEYSIPYFFLEVLSEDEKQQYYKYLKGLPLDPVERVYSEPNMFMNGKHSLHYPLHDLNLELNNAIVPFFWKHYKNHKNQSNIFMMHSETRHQQYPGYLDDKDKMVLGVGCTDKDALEHTVSKEIIALQGVGYVSFANDTKANRKRLGRDLEERFLVFCGYADCHNAYDGLKIGQLIAEAPNPVQFIGYDWNKRPIFSNPKEAGLVQKFYGLKVEKRVETAN